MKNTTKLFTLFLIICLACSPVEDNLSNHFDNNQLVTINEIISFYDSFVLNEEKGIEPIESAYLSFLNKSCAIALKNGDLSILIPKLKVEFFEKINQDHLSTIYYIKDSVKYYHLGNDTTVIQPFSLSLNTNGQYMQLIKSLSVKNDFYKSYYQSIINFGDLGPSCYSLILNNHKEINFSKKEERLIFIINILHAQEAYNFE